MGRRLIAAATALLILLALMPTGSDGVILIRRLAGGATNPVAAEDWSENTVVYLKNTTGSGDWLDASATTGSAKTNFCVAADLPWDCCTNADSGCTGGGDENFVADNFDLAGSMAYTNTVLPPGTPTSSTFYALQTFDADNAGMTCDATDDCADIDSSGTGTGMFAWNNQDWDVTVTTWVNATQTGNRDLFDWYNETSSHGMWLGTRLSNPDITFRCNFRDNSQVTLTGTAGTVESGQWSFISCRWEKAQTNNMRLWSIDDDQVGTVTSALLASWDYGGAANGVQLVSDSNGTSGTDLGNAHLYDFAISLSALTDADNFRVAACDMDGVLCACDGDDPTRYAACTTNSDCQAGGAAPVALCTAGMTNTCSASVCTVTDDSCTTNSDCGTRCMGRDMFNHSNATIGNVACNAVPPHQ